MEDRISMSKTDLKRLRIVHKVINKQITQTQAGELIGVGDRQIRRLVSRVAGDGDTGIIHKSVGKESNNKLAAELKQNVLNIYKEKYGDFSPTFFGEKLSEIHSIKVSKETLRKWLLQDDIKHFKRRVSRGAVHAWRERKHHEGELIQVDGSHHRWLEDRLDQEFCLMGYIDDATNEYFARFYEYEGTFPFFDSFEAYIKQYGIPEAIYVDGHSTYKVNRSPTIDEELKNKQAHTQVEKALNKLDVTVIQAGSAQAKGRVERSFNTLQDRLVKEMRLANITSIAGANEFLKTYLPEFNNRFAKKAKSEHSLFRECNKTTDYKWIFVIQDSRTINNDYTIRWKNRLFLVNNPKLTNKKQKILVKQAMNGDLQFETKHKIISVQEITEKQLQDTKYVNKEICKILKRKEHKKAKKSWMDDFYIGNPKPVLVK